MPLSRLHSLPPERPVSEDVQSVRAAKLPEASAALAATRSEAAIVATSTTRSEVEPVWQVLLDVSVWRSRPWWWRLAASLVVRRLGR